jgi:hypothetical protein
MREELSRENVPSLALLSNNKWKMSDKHETKDKDKIRKDLGSE